MGDRAGQRLDNYRLLRLLGAGSFGEVYLAEQVYRKNRVAVKVLPQLADDDLPNFLNEARTIRLRHPSIVQVLDFGVDSRTPFIVMEYIPNGTLRQHYPRGTRLSTDKLVSYVKQVADALQYAHDEKLIHRDVKPENILLKSDDEVLLSDFGIATMARSSRSQGVLEMAGTMAYMAPEQIQGKPVLASDQYALGVIVYEYLCGERPFSGGPMEIATQHMVTPPPPLSRKFLMLPSEIEQVVMTALAKEPSKRFASVRAFAHALEQASKVPKQPVHPVLNPIPSTPAAPPISSLPKEQEPLVNRAPTFTESVKTPETNTAGPIAEKSFSPPSPSVRDTLSPSKSTVSTTNSELKTEAGKTFSPTSIGIKTSRNRLFYPMLALAAFLVVAMMGGGAYFYLRGSAGINVDQSLQNARELMNTANKEVTANPAAALQDLATAQSTLRPLLGESLSTTQHNKLLNLLQGDLPGDVKAAINTYNTREHITPLPCPPTSSPALLNEGTIGTHAQTIVSVQSKNGASLFALGQDNKLYQVTSNTSLKPFPLPSPLTNAKVLDIADYGSELVLLIANGTSPTSYTLALLSPDQRKVQQTSQINPDLIINGQTPKLIAVSLTDVYVVVASDSTQQSSATILDYAPNKVYQPLSLAPTRGDFSVSATIVSMAALPQHQLFFLLADGSVKNLAFAGGTQEATPVFVQQAIAQPLALSASDFTWQKTVPVPSIIHGGIEALVLPGATSSRALVAAQVNNVPHLYVLDALSHRVLDLLVVDAFNAPVTSTQTPTSSITPTSTSTGGGVVTGTGTTPLNLHLARQYASSTLLAEAKSMAVDAQGSQVTVLSQTQQNTPPLSLVSFSTISQDGCV